MFAVRRLKKLRSDCIVCVMNTAENRPETPDIIRGLLQMEHQRIVSTFAPGSASPAAVSAEDCAWRQRNTEMHPYREIMVILKDDILAVFILHDFEEYIYHALITGTHHILYASQLVVIKILLCGFLVVHAQWRIPELLTAGRCGLVQVLPGVGHHKKQL